MLPSCAVGVLDPSSRRWECIVLASNLVSLIELIISAQTLRALPEICSDWVLP